MEVKDEYKKCEEIYSKVGLREGFWPIVSLLAIIAKNPKISIKELAQKAMLPIPICVAIRNEFVKQGWCKKERGSELTKEGYRALERFGYVNIEINCSKCKGTGIEINQEEIKEKLKIMKKYANMRGTPKTTIDQSYATPLTSIMRILYANKNFDLLRKNFAFVGDSDLTSVAMSLFVPKTKKITVFDIDERVEKIITEVNENMNTNIEFIKTDLRKPIEEQLRKKYDCVFTDPPYTREGCRLFISRSVELLNNKLGGVIYLSFGIKPAKEMIEIQQDLSEMGCLITNIEPRFNKYVGAQKLASISNLYRIVTTPGSKPIIEGEYEGPLYTGDVNPIVKIYECTKCKLRIEVGRGKEYRTIEDLKSLKCPKCGNNKFQKIKEMKQKEKFKKRRKHNSDEQKEREQ